MAAFPQASYNKQRKDKFILVIPLPDAIKKIDSKVTTPSPPSNSGIKFDSLTLSVYGAIVPEIKVAGVSIPYGGQHYNVSSMARPTYSELSVNFTIDNRFTNYWAIYSWLNILNNQKESYLDVNNVLNVQKVNQKSASTYMSDISLYALDEYEKQVIEFRYTRAFPTTLGGINFNQRDAGEIETTVSFAYSQIITQLVEQVDSL